MNNLQIRNVIFGEGRPKICVPIVGKTEEEILNAAWRITSCSADVVEWRADWFEQVFQPEKVLDTARQLRFILQDTPLLFTFRTAKEGGEKEISEEMYETLNRTVVESGYADLIDVEVFTDEALVRRIIAHAHEHKTCVIGSNHDFHKTPDKEELIRRLCYMQELDADLPKIAVMPTCRQDVLTLLSATLEMQEQHADRPIITMSMAGTGVISRLAGECFGSALTFGAVGQTSAPGQIPMTELAQVLDIIHHSL